MVEVNPAEALVERARLLGLSVAVAESLTGGLVASRIVDVPGASQVFVGGVIAYHPDVKRTLLGVDGTLLTDGGAVQEEVALQMARGVRERFATLDSDSDTPHFAAVSVATTGVAGPAADPTTGQQPGIAWIAVSSARGDRAELFEFAGDRQAIREACASAALRMLDDEILALA